MQISGLERFVEIAEAGSYYRAEITRGEISAQAYSKVVSSLEKELGVRLVRTSRKGVELTPEGTVLLEFARSTLNEYTKLQVRLRDAHHPSRPKPPTVHATFYAASVISELIPQGLLTSNMQVREEPFDVILAHANSYGETELALIDLQDDYDANALKSKNLSFKSLIDCKPMAVVAENSNLALLDRDLRISDLWGARIVCNSHPEMLHKYRKILNALPRETEVNSFSSVRGLWEYLRMNPDCIFLADSVQGALSLGTEQSVSSGFVFRPLAIDRLPAKLGVLRVRRERKSPAVNELVREFSKAFAELSRQTLEPSPEAASEELA